MKYSHTNKPILAALILVTLLTFSCKKDRQDGLGTGEARVNVLLSAVDFEEKEEQARQSKSVADKRAGKLQPGSINSDADDHSKQTFTLPFDDNMMIFGSFETVTPVNNKNATHGDRGADTPSQRAQAEITPLLPNIQYRLIVYDENGLYVTDRLYTYTQESSATPLLLDGGKAYTFVAISINSTSSVPNVSYANASVRTLATASVNTVTAGYFMHFKQRVTLTTGNNNLNVVLKHMFSQITTNILVDEEIGGVISAVSNPILRPIHANATINLDTRAITYGALNTAGVSVTFPAISSGGTKILTSFPTLLRTPAVTSGSLTLNSLTVNGVTRNNVLVPNLRVNPGEKYNLNLRLSVPCTQDVFNEVINIRLGSSVEFTSPATDRGFFVDIFSLDNSFSITVNGSRISNQEIQFQPNLSPPLNIRFEDGSRWGAGGVPDIWTMRGSANSPILRVVISETGAVTMFGSKSNTGPLLPLVPTGALVFNNVPWNTTGSNTVRITQVQQGDTFMTGRARGINTAGCPN